jgi:hypothetical protein
MSSLMFLVTDWKMLLSWLSVACPALLIYIMASPADP